MARDMQVTRGTSPAFGSLGNGGLAMVKIKRILCVAGMSAVLALSGTAAYASVHVKVVNTNVNVQAGFVNANQQSTNSSGSVGLGGSAGVFLSGNSSSGVCHSHC
jgi:hypothetical protein